MRLQQLSYSHQSRRLNQLTYATQLTLLIAVQLGDLINAAKVCTTALCATLLLAQSRS